MRTLLLLTGLLLFVGCQSIKEMNESMQESNGLLKQNIAAMQESSTVIRENTREIDRSTHTMLFFGAAYILLIAGMTLVVGIPAYRRLKRY